MLNRDTALAFVAVLAFGKVQAQEGPDLGVEASAEEIAAWDISISPDGAGLPAGSGTASLGASIYASQCLVCHGAEGGGQPNDRLAGGHGSLIRSHLSKPWAAIGLLRLRFSTTFVVLCRIFSRSPSQTTKCTH